MGARLLATTPARDAAIQLAGEPWYGYWYGVILQVVAGPLWRGSFCLSSSPIIIWYVFPLFLLIVRPLYQEVVFFTVMHDGMLLSHWPSPDFLVQIPRQSPAFSRMPNNASAMSVARVHRRCCLLANPPPARSIQSPGPQLDGWSRSLDSALRFRPRGVSGDNPSTCRPASTLTTLGLSSTTTSTPDLSANTLAQPQFGRLF